MPGEVVIGSVAVKVLPDLTNFRRETKRELEQAEKTLPDVEVEVSPDGSGLPGKVRKIVEAADKAAPNIKVGVEVDNASALKAISAVNDAISRTRTKLKIGVETPKLTQVVKDLKKKLSAAAEEGSRDISFAGKKFMFEAGLDLGGTKAELAKRMKELEAQLRPLEIELKTSLSPKRKAELEAKIEAIKADMSDIEAFIKPSIDKSSLIAAKARLIELSRTRTATIVVRVSKRSITQASGALSRITGIRMLWDLHKAKLDAAFNFDQIAPKVAQFATALALLSSYLSVAVNNILSLGNGIAAIVPGVVALPGMLAGLAASVWVVARAFQDFDKVLPGFKSSWEELGEIVSSNFWAKAQEPMQEMLTKLFPQFSKGIQKVATEAGTYIGALAKGMQDQFDGKLEAMLGNVSKALNTMSKSAADTARWFRVLMEVGMAQLPAFANWWNDINKSFADFMENAQKSGDLQKWIDTAVENLKDLGSIIVNLGKLWGNLGRIAEAAGGSTLASLRDTMEKAAAITSSPEFIKGATIILKSMYDFVGQIGEAIGAKIADLANALTYTIPQALGAIGGPLNAAIQGLLAGLADEKFQYGLIAMFDGIGVAVNALAPVMEVLAAKIGTVFSLVGDVVAQLGPLLSAFILELAHSLDIVGPALSSALLVIGPAMEQAFVTVGPAILSLVTAFAALLPLISELTAGLAANLAPVLNEIGLAVGQFLLSAIEAIKPHIPAIVEAVTVLANGLRDILPIIGEALISALTILLPIIIQVVSAIGSFLSAIAPVAAVVLPIIIKIIGFVLTMVADAVMGVINGLTSIVQGIVNIVQGIWNFFAGLFTGDWARVWEGVKQIFSGVWQTIVGLLQVYIYGSFLRIVGAGLGLVKALWKGGWNTILSILRAVWSAITAVLQAGWNILKSLFTGGINLVKSIWTNGWSAIGNILKTAWNAITNAVRTGITTVVNFFKELPGKIKDVLSSLPATLWKLGSDAIAGMLGGMSAMAGQVIDKAKEIASGVKNAITGFFDIQSPSRVMMEVGGHIMEGLAIGIANMGKRAITNVENVAAKIAAVPFELSTVDSSGIDGINLGSARAQLAGVAADGSAGGRAYNTTINLNGTNVTANDVAEELLGAYRRVDRGGKYGRQV